MAQDPLVIKSVTAGDVGKVQNGVIYLTIPITSWGINQITLPPEAPIYWTPNRDYVLRATIHKESMWAAAVGIAITKAASWSWEITSDSDVRRKRLHEVLMEADTRRVGWSGFIAKQLRDFLLTDNGSFCEIVRVSRAIGSRIIGLRHLDSTRCTRTGDPQIPVLYTDRVGKIHELKDHQVITLSDMPDSGDAYFGVGLCAAARAYNAIYKLASIEWYLREKVTGMKPLAIHVVNGILSDQIQGAVEAAKAGQVSRGVTAYMGAVIIGVPSQEQPQVATIPLAELPERFNRKEEFDLSVLTYADALGMDPQELQPLTGQALGTGAQSSVLHDKQAGKGIVFWRMSWTHALNEYVTGEKDTFVFVEKDYRDLKAKADIESTHAETSGKRIAQGITSPEQERQILVDYDDLPKEFLEQDITAVDNISDIDKPEDTQARVGVAPTPEQAGAPGAPGTPGTPAPAKPGQPPNGKPVAGQPAAQQVAGQPAAAQPVAQPAGKPNPKPFGWSDEADQDEEEDEEDQKKPVKKELTDPELEALIDQQIDPALELYNRAQAEDSIGKVLR